MIYIIGSGAVGKALAVSLQHDGKNVVLLRGSIGDGPAYTENIRVLMPGKPALEATIEVSTLEHFAQLNGIIVLTNKSYGNPGIAERLKNKTKNSPIVLLQNGLGIEQVFLQNQFPEIYRCVLFITSQVNPSGEVSYKPVNISPIGTVKAHNSSLADVVNALNSDDFPFRAEPLIEPVIWKKAIVNCVFNSICPLLGVDNGIFKRDDAALGMAGRIIRECLLIAQAKGINLTDNEVTESLLTISELSNGQLISTLQDINNHRKTEIDTLNFAIVAMAKQLGKENLVTETRLLGELIKLKSDLSS